MAEQQATQSNTEAAAEEARSSPQPAEVSAPNTEVNHRELGNIAFKKGDIAKALHCYQTALAADPKNDTLYSNMALCALKQNNWVDAMQWANEAIMLSNGQNAKAWFRRGSVFLKTDMSPLTAFYDFKEAYHLQPASPEVRVALYDLRSVLPSKHWHWKEFPQRHLDPHWRSVLQAMRNEDSPLSLLYWDSNIRDEGLLYAMNAQPKDDGTASA